MNNHLISREALKKHKVYSEERREYVVPVYNIDNAPTVPLPDFKEGYKQAIIDGKTNFSRPHGEWIYDGHNSTDLDKMFVCSICGRRIHTSLQNLVDYPFCHCGAAMRGGAENEIR